MAVDYQAVLLIGILGILFLSGIWYLWAFLIIIGGLTLFTAISKQNTAQGELRWAEETITKSRSKLAELRAQLTIV